MAKNPPAQSGTIYEFGEFVLDVRERLMLKDGVPIALSPKIFDLLVFFLENPGRLLGKADIMRRVWADTYVEEATLTRSISEVRKALGDFRKAKKIIETVSKQGYRFVASVQILAPPAVEAELDLLPAPPVSALATGPHIGKNYRYLAGALSLCVLFLALGSLSIYLKYYGAQVGPGSLAVLPLGSSWLLRSSSDNYGPVPRSLAVLPFKHLGISGGVQFLELGMADTLITRLSNVSQLSVRPTGAICKYIDPQQDPINIGRMLRVDAVLDGSVQQLNDKIRISVRLIRVQDAKSLWAASFDERFSNLFSLQDSISRDVAETLVLELTSKDKRRLLEHPTENLGAYQSYVEGRFFWNKRTAAGFAKAIDFFQQAIQQDPKYSLAYAGLADAYLLQGDYNYSLATPTESLPKAKRAAQQALELDPALAEAHTTLAGIAEDYDMDWSTSEREYKLAIQLNPNYAVAHAWYGAHLAYMGRFDEGAAEMRRALEIDPASLTLNADYGQIQLLARHYDQGIQQLQKGLEMDQTFIESRWMLAIGYGYKGRTREALAECKAINKTQDDVQTRLGLAWAYAQAGNRPAAIRILDEVRRGEKRQYVSPLSLSLVYLALQRNGEAMTQLERAYATHAPGLLALKVDPAFDALRSQCRFQSLLKTMNLTDQQQLTDSCGKPSVNESASLHL